MRVATMEGEMGTVCSAGLEIRVSLALVEGTAVGDYVIVHAGYAIQRLTDEEAHETLEILSKLEESHEDGSSG
jgi:hydrogenase expression/formation protein HypC